MICSDYRASWQKILSQRPLLLHSSCRLEVPFIKALEPSKLTLYSSRTTTTSVHVRGIRLPTGRQAERHGARNGWTNDVTQGHTRLLTLIRRISHVCAPTLPPLLASSLWSFPSFRLPTSRATTESDKRSLSHWNDMGPKIQYSLWHSSHLAALQSVNSRGPSSCR